MVKAGLCRKIESLKPVRGKKMSEKTDKSGVTGENAAQSGVSADGELDLSAFGNFSFTPDWVKTPPSSRFGAFQQSRNGSEGDEGRSEDRAPRRRDRNDAGGGSFRKMRSEKKPFDRERKFDGDRETGRKNAGGRGDDGKRGRMSDSSHEHFQQRRRFESEPLLDVEVRVLPEPKALGSVIRKIQFSDYAFPLRDIANLFLDNSSAVLLRLDPRKPRNTGSHHAPQKDNAQERAAGQERPRPDISLFQCKVCGLPALSEAEMEAHILSAHISNYYDIEEVECEPPKGAFSCVAKCGLTGELLGPPNLHDFGYRIQEMLRTRFPGMTEEEYRSKIVMEHDKETVEAWRASATKKLLYRRKAEKPAETSAGGNGAEGSAGEGAVANAGNPALEKDRAEIEFRNDILPGLIMRPKLLLTTAAAGLKSSSKALVRLFKAALAQERRFPASLFFALRGAFRNKKLEFFRVNDFHGPEFVTCMKYSKLDVEHAVEHLKKTVEFIEAHPASTFAEIEKGVNADGSYAPDEIEKILLLLSSKGNVVKFFDGEYSMPAKFPVFKFRKTGAGSKEDFAAMPTSAPVKSSVGQTQAQTEPEQAAGGDPVAGNATADGADAEQEQQQETAGTPAEAVADAASEQSAEGAETPPDTAAE